MTLAITFTANDHGMRMLRKPVESCTGEQIIGEHFWPFFKSLVAGNE
jgi:hypothetical protein